MQRVAIIGAGISGLMCARLLSSQFEVTLFDKSRGVSGRMATRRVDEFDIAFDHGAQYFTIRSEAMQTWLDQWLESNVVARWNGNVVVLRPGMPPEQEPTVRYVANPAMNALGKHLAKGQSIETNTQISQAEKTSGGWMLSTTEDVQHGPFDLLISTVPPTQALDILGEVSPLREVLLAQEFDPCWATLVYFAEPVPISYDAAFVHENPLRWICRNNSKPGRNSEKECWVLHASGDWSNEYQERASDEITPRLLKAFTEATGCQLPEIRYATSHHWRFSAPKTPLERSFLWDETSQLGICGDWCSGARVEGALFSGYSLASQLLEQFR
ncbi:FAD-dependent oxidoreductase [bacterium]|nr:FAD-dependent oxidoreductase [bacterium]